MQCHVSLNACHTQLFVILCIPSAYCGNNSMSTHYTLLEYDLHANPIEPWKLPQGQGATRARNPSTLLDPVLLLRCFSRFRRRRRTIQEVQPQSTVRFYQQLLKIQAGRRLVSRPGNRKFPKVRHSKWVNPKEENRRKQYNGKWDKSALYPWQPPILVRNHTIRSILRSRPHLILLQFTPTHPKSRNN